MGSSESLSDRFPYKNEGKDTLAGDFCPLNQVVKEFRRGGLVQLEPLSVFQGNAR